MEPPLPPLPPLPPPPPRHPVLVSIVIAAHNRRDVVLGTLARLREAGLGRGEFETIVVDNASTDGTADAITAAFGRVRVIRRKTNGGSVAKNDGIVASAGRFIVFLDDDSYPQPGAVERMIDHFVADPQLGAAGFTVTLPDGSRECSAYPDVFIGCGAGFRRRALQQVGGLPPDFFMQAEEYDLSLRLLDAGWRVRTFDDLHVTHLKSPAARSHERTTRLDVRNNLLLVRRRFPAEWVAPFAREWLARYWLIARVKGHRRAFVRGAAEGFARTMNGDGRAPVSREVFETFAKLDQTRVRLAAAVRESGVRRVLLVDYGKNMLAYRLAAEACGVEVVGVADAKLGHLGAHYHGVPILPDGRAMTLRYDAAVVGNLSPAHAAARREQWRRMQPKPVFDLFERA